jgi:DNA recombination protein RmuC
MTTEVLLVLVLGAVVLLLGLSLVLQRGLMRELRSELTEARREAQDGARESRTELTSTLNQFSQTLQQQMGSNTTTQNSRIDGFSSQLAMLIKSNEERLAEVRNVLENKLRELQQDNATRLEEMRKTVDERLQSTLEKRLGESFSQVSQHLEQVLKGLGEMNTLAAGVGDLKRVLTNVRSRGTWGEVQLGNLLEQTLTAEQYARNVATRPGSRERVEYAIRLPGQDSAHVVWLPVDAKFPVEDYERLLAAQERADAPGMEEAGRALENRIRLEAKTIREKYVEVPHTTDFAILFLPTEGLYAEVLRRPGLADNLQREFRVSIAGPTTLSALLNSLQMGFRTLAIEKRSAEVWQVLGGVKAEFERFGSVLAATKRQLQTVANSIDQAETRTRQMSRQLRAVEALPGAGDEAGGVGGVAGLLDGVAPEEG